MPAPPASHGPQASFEGVLQSTLCNPRRKGSNKLALHCTAPLAVPVPRKHLYRMSTAWQQCRLSTEQAAFCSTNASYSTITKASHHHDPPLSMPVLTNASCSLHGSHIRCLSHAGCHYGPLFPISLLLVLQRFSVNLPVARTSRNIELMV